MNEIKYIIIFIILLNTVFFYGCSVEKKFESVDKFEVKENIKSERVITKFIIKSSKNRIYGKLKSVFILPANFYGMIEIKQNGDILFYIESVRYITSWANGWTHGENKASGIIKFKRMENENRWKAIVIEEIIIWELTKGEIRYYSDFFQDENGLRKVKNRMDRIKAFIKFIKNQKIFPDFFGSPWLKTKYSKSFSRIMKKYLLNKNNEYPEYLKLLWKSKTIHRDLDEAVELFFMEYNMNYYFNNLLNNSIFIEK